MSIADQVSELFTCHLNCEQTLDREIFKGVKTGFLFCGKDGMVGGYGRLSELAKITLCSYFTTLSNIACPFTHNSGQCEDLKKFRILFLKEPKYS